jgi:hypothetical protein
MKHRFYFLASLLLLTSVLSIPTVAEATSEISRSTPTATGNPDAGTSVVWLVLDELPLYALLKTDGTINEVRYPGFAKLASTSTWYRNTLATAQRTTEALPAMLTGKWPTIRDYPVLADHPINLFTLTRRHKKLDVYQSITSLCPKGVCPNRIPKAHREPGFKLQAFRNLMDHASTSTERTIHFSHILLPHRPWRFATDGRMGKDMESDPRPSNTVDRRRDSYQSLLRQLVATDALLLDFLNQLEASANWNRTMLVVTSDHGMTFVPGESFRDEVNPNRPETLEDIYRVPLFIKYPHQSSGALNNCPVTSVDILPTVLSVSEIRTKAKFDGVDLSKTCPRRSFRRVRWPYTGANLTTDFRAVVQRVKYYDKWVDADGTVDDIHRVGRSGQLLGTNVPQSAKTLTSVRWRNIDPTSFDNIGDSRFSYVPARVSGVVTTSRPLCARCEGILVVDGVIVASVPELAGLKPTPNSIYFTTSTLTSKISSTSGKPELWIADWTTRSPGLTRVGPAINEDLNK